ncbi:TAXI family TRAP transporter solute-binding subunit [Salipiger pacificus]|uniref:TAXI family TRAP transporter solute-binding subunit n=2 Tax=Salipiger mangrovisoli TaxID=2865933 RepID=A0ABR9XAA5_9RHOB|nr:TAXI family TRAP transporter solute-binding subunit [Salipiger mangrovisoli]
MVDATLRVRGSNGPRVVDASIMPRILSGKAASPIVMIAEKSAVMILRSQERGGTQDTKLWTVSRSRRVVWVKCHRLHNCTEPRVPAQGMRHSEFNALEALLKRAINVIDTYTNALVRAGEGPIDCGCLRYLSDFGENSMKNQTLLAALAVSAAVAAGSVSAQEMSFFRIGTGGTAGTYYPIGGLLANAISSPPGSRACEEGGSCGVPGLVASALSANGSVANINAIAGGTLESGFSQSDVATWAYTGTGIWDGKEPVEKLRAIANLYPESIHLVASADSGIASVADLKGKRVSMDEPGSGTLVDARIILEGYGLSEADVKAEFLKPDQAADRMRDGAMDAFFFVGGYPAGAIAELSSQHDVTIVPISCDDAPSICETYGFFASDTIPGGTYEGTADDVNTLSVGAQWITSADQPEELIYGITKALWNDNTRKQLDAGHAKGKVITKETALNGIGIPLHPGAERFYKEAGLLTE